MTNIQPAAAVIDGLSVIDLARVWRALERLPPVQSLPGFLEAAGATIDDRFVLQPNVGLSGIGGLPVEIDGTGDLSLAGQPIRGAALREGSQRMMAFIGGMSYLNPVRLTPDEMYDRIRDHGHFSMAHGITVNLTVAGISCGVENEFNSQRDLVHLGRVTVARTTIQRRPLLVLPDESLRPAYEAVLEAAQTQRDALPHGGRALNEAANLLFPAAKASAFVLSGTLRNIQKLVAVYHDDGKEREYRNALAAISTTLNPLWPEIFQPLDAIPYSV